MASFVNTTVNQPASGSFSRSGRTENRHLLARVWDGLLRFGEARAAAEVARHVRIHGGRSSGNLKQDAEQLASLRNMTRHTM